jgi:hypothetical protein
MGPPVDDLMKIRKKTLLDRKKNQRLHFKLAASGIGQKIQNQPENPPLVVGLVD